MVKPSTGRISGMARACHAHKGRSPKDVLVGSSLHVTVAPSHVIDKANQALLVELSWRISGMARARHAHKWRSPKDRLVDSSLPRPFLG